MQLEHDALPRAVGILDVRSAGAYMRGTGFLINPTRVITCAHCVRSPEGDLIETGTIAFTQTTSPTPVPFRVVFERYDLDAGIDVAVLALDAPVPGTSCLSWSQANRASGDDWRAFGHPATVGKQAVYLGGDVQGRIAARAGASERNWLLALRVDETVSELAGVSGAPVLGDQGVLGVLSNQLFQMVIDGSAPVNVAYAVPTQRLIDLPGFVEHTSGARLKAFIAYRRDAPEAALAKGLFEALKREGHDPFIDLEIDVGDDWPSTIRRKIEQADAFVPILTAASIESEMCLQEIRIAYRSMRRSGRPVILPIRSPELVLPYEFEMYVGGRLQYAPWRGDVDSDAVIGSVEKALRQQAFPPRETVEEPAPKAVAPATGFVPITPTTGAVRLEDRFYATRSSDKKALQRVAGPPTNMTIIGPSGHGKSSLLVRMRQSCIEKKRTVAFIDFQAFGDLPEDEGPRRGYTSFLTDFTRRLSKAFGLPPPIGVVEDHIDAQERLLEVISRCPQAVLILDGIDRLVAREYANAFFSLFRAWANDPELAFTFVFAIANDPSYLITNANVSPFNLDPDPVRLTSFSVAAVGALSTATHYGLARADLDSILEVTGGHPALTRHALAYVLAPDLDASEPMAPSRAMVAQRLTDIFDKCGSLNGPFSAPLKALESRLSGTRPEYGRTLRKIARREQLDQDDVPHARKLEAHGLVRSNDDQFEPYNLIYSRAFNRVTNPGLR